MPPEKTYTYLKLKFKKTTGTKLSSQSVYDLVTQYLIVAYFLDEYRTVRTYVGTSNRLHFNYTTLTVITMDERTRDMDTTSKDCVNFFNNTPQKFNLERRANKQQLF